MESHTESNGARDEKKMTDEERMAWSGAKESGYHAPTKGDIKDIKHNHNTAEPGSVTADEAIRQVSGDAGDADPIQ